MRTFRLFCRYNPVTHSNHSPLAASLSVVSDFSRIRLNAKVHTTRGVLFISPLRGGLSSNNASLHIDASTSHAPATVYLAPDYEGTFDLATTRAQAVVEENNKGKPRDPTGKGRMRTLYRQSFKDGGKKKAHGWVYWSYAGQTSEEGKERGSVKVRSSDKAVILYV